MNTTDYQAMQVAFGTHSRTKFAAPDPGPEKRLVPVYVGDDEADWTLHDAERAPNASRALAALKKAAPRLGHLQAAGSVTLSRIHQAFEAVAGRNGLPLGKEGLWATMAEVGPVIRQSFDTSVAEIAAPHIEATRKEILDRVEGHDEQNGEINCEVLKRDIVYHVENIVKRFPVPHGEILDYFAKAAGLTDAEINGPIVSRERFIADFDLRLDSLMDFAEQRGEEATRETLLARHFEKRWKDDSWREVQIARIDQMLIGWRAVDPSANEWLGSPRVLVDPFHGANRRERFEITMFDDLDEEVAKEWLVDDLLGAGEFSCFWGMPGCGKSVIVGDAAFHVASGLDWHGKPVKRGLVVFIAAERAELTVRRFTAIKKRRDVKGIPLAVVKGRLDLTSSPQDARDIVEAVRGIEEQKGEQCVWVIIDTVARTFGAGDENKQADMGAYVKACDLIRDELSAHVTVIHHCSRSGEKPRGSIALDGAVDATFRVAKSGAIHTVAIDKENDAPGGGAIRFRMEGVELGTDRRGKVTTAPIAVPDTETVVAFDAGGVAVALKAKGSKASAALQQAIAESAEHSPEGRPAVAVSELRKRLRAAFAKPGQKVASLDAIERRAFKGLIDSGEAERVGEWIMLPIGTPGTDGGGQAEQG